MDIRLLRVLFPDLKIRLHIDLFDAVQGRDIKFPHGFIVFRRVSCCHDHPSFRYFLIAKCLSLKKLQHHRRQGL